MRPGMSAHYTHRDAIAAIDAGELARLKQTSDRPALARAAAHFGLLALTGLAVLHAPNWAVWFAAALAHGIVLVFLFTLEHEAIHGTAFRSPALNKAFAAFAGLVLVLPPNHFRYFHFAHHRFTQDPERDPELASPKPGGWQSYVIHLSGLPYWWHQASLLLNHACGRKIGVHVPAGGKRKVIAEARIYLALPVALAASSLTFGWTWPLELWIAPALLGQPFLRAFLLAEHAACPLVEDMLVNSRTTFTNSIIRFLGWNMPFHTAHHALPVVPFHRLPELSQLLESRLASTAPGYIAAHRQIRRAWVRSA
jgi:fatty acid desaturase